MKSQCPIKLPAVVLPFSRSSFFQICARHMCLPAHILHVGRTFIFQSLAQGCLSASSSLPAQVFLSGRILINLHYNLHIFDRRIKSVSPFASSLRPDWTKRSRQTKLSMNIIFAEIGPWHTYIYKITQEIGIPSQIMFCLGAIYFPKERRGVGANQGVISTKIFLPADPLSLKPLSL